jgi:hypothetical protein
MRRSKQSRRLNENIRSILQSHCHTEQLSETMILTNQAVEQQLLSLGMILYIASSN